MRYSTRSREQKYIKGYGFISFARKFSDKCSNKLMDTATKTVKNIEMDAVKLHLKELLKKQQWLQDI